MEHDTRELVTIQRRHNLNKVFAVDGENVGECGANHAYLIMCDDEPVLIYFQNGPRNVEGSERGILDVDLLEIVRDRLKGFQSGKFSCRENACALTHIEEALMWMNKRVEDRAARNVLGTNEK
ncbi:MAG: ABC transporter ATPase [Ruminococcus sp.]|nr:ABC transporter ATPase [Ruminococcus sp.]